ncbi:MAG: ATP synthase F1 subunit gamma [Deltaproteobacteria bacterium]|nr:MAG: ATP synthase F1 subunit gamma [Deltaproteobacteria bacterium]
MPNLKEIKRRIDSVKSTKKITSAMKLVAGAKLRRATDAATKARPYQDKLSSVLTRVGALAEDSEEPLLQVRDEVKKILVVVLTTDRGLCGGFNNNMLRKSVYWLREKQQDGVEYEIRTFGRKGRDFYKSAGFSVADAQVDLARTAREDLARPLSHLMVSGFTSGEYDECYLVYNEFVNAITQVPTFKRVLPIAMDDAEEAAGGDFDFEPGPDAVLSALLPLYLRTVLLQGFLETDAGEHAARMTAMDNATSNASDLIGELTLVYNRARQAAITTEITEIVSGAEAL